MDPHRIAAAAWLAAFALACSSPSGGNNLIAGDGGSNDAGLPGTDGGPGADGGSVITGTVGPSGGSLSVAGATLAVPAGALASATDITITATSEATPDGYHAYSKLYRFEPAGLTFAKPVSVSIPFAIAPGSDTANPTNDPRLATLFWSRKGATGYERLSAKIAGEVATAGVSHFSAGFAGNGIAYLDPPDRSCARTFSVGDRPVETVHAGLALFFTAEDCQGRPLPKLTCADAASCDFAVEEDGAALPGAVVPTVLAAPGRQVFVTLVLDTSPTMGSLGPEIEAAKQFVTRLQLDLKLPVQIGVQIFGGADMVTELQPPTLNTELLFTQLDGLASQQSPVASADFYNTLVAALQAQASARAEYERRNAGGAVTAGYVVAFTADPDMVGSAAPSDVAALKKSTSQSLAILPLAGLDAATLGDLSSLSDLSLAPTPDASGLYRDLTDLANLVALRWGAFYPLAYCSPARGAGTHAAAVKVRGAALDPALTAASFSFASAGFADGCTTARLQSLCAGGPQCGGVLCGVCDDRTSSGCDSAAGTCTSWCDSMVGACGGKVVTNPLGYAQKCDDRIEATLCGGLCRDLRGDVDNCGGCGWQCPYTCSAGVCACPPMPPTGQLGQWSWCAGYCVDLTWNDSSCGSCGNLCSGNQICVSSACKPDPLMPEGLLPAESPADTDYDLSVADVAKDKVTGLIWQRSPPTGVVTFPAAYQYCAGLSLGGSDGWRLPTRAEILGIVDSSRTSPAINGSAFTAASGPYWTGIGTMAEMQSLFTYVVDFNIGGSDYLVLTTTALSNVTHYVRCVR